MTSLFTYKQDTTNKIRGFFLGKRSLMFDIVCSYKKDNYVGGSMTSLFTYEQDTTNKIRGFFLGKRSLMFDIVCSYKKDNYVGGL